MDDAKSCVKLNNISKREAGRSNKSADDYVAADVRLQFPFSFPFEFFATKISMSEPGSEPHSSTFFSYSFSTVIQKY